eukprot:GEZU01004560.1.p1 GENE.GEZU01004560.1~~GEZU01004560.1.p1  ORF type:complete len:114 (+),score=25.94 GEZU01004560.1:32-343(+)
MSRFLDLFTPKNLSQNLTSFPLRQFYKVFNPKGLFATTLYIAVPAIGIPFLYAVYKEYQLYKTTMALKQHPLFLHVDPRQFAIPLEKPAFVRQWEEQYGNKKQ